MQVREALRDWDGTARLIWIVAAGAVFAAFWVLQHGGGSWTSRVWGAFLVAFAPAVIAFPALARIARRCIEGWHLATPSGSLHELERLRRVGAI